MLLLLNINLTDCSAADICSVLRSSLSLLPRTDQELFPPLARHLLRGALLISLGQHQLERAETSCPGEWSVAKQQWSNKQT